MRAEFQVAAHVLDRRDREADLYPIDLALGWGRWRGMPFIPAGESAFQGSTRIDEGERIRLQGYLVDIRREDGGRWTISLSRTDTGHVACELFIVTLSMVL